MDRFDPIQIVLSGAILITALAASAHASIYKRDSRAAALWIIVVWLLPLAGPFLYLLLGINRVRRRATALRGSMIRHRTEPEVVPCNPALVEALPLQDIQHLCPLARLADEVSARPLLPGNTISPLLTGSEIFPAMLEAIDSANESIALAAYIFDGVGIGSRFADALSRAHRRGVQIRVLIDDVGARLSRSSAAKALRRSGVPVAMFNPPLVPASLIGINLRNHRKILVVDGATGFTGGANIDRRYWKPDSPEEAFVDLHFRLRGPVVAHLVEVFADDWQFTTGEALRGPEWFPPLPAEGTGLARGIEAGPDESLDRLRWTIIGALNAAQRSVRIFTPYFIPDAALISAMNAAAMRGVEVEIFLPAHSNMPHAQWAAFSQLWQVLERGCKVWLTPGRFDHSKLMLMDGSWCLIGSANWDARSLRLNFEFNVECYDTELGNQLEGFVSTRRAAARQLTKAELDARPFPVKLRDGVARLFAPFL